MRSFFILFFIFYSYTGVCQIPIGQWRVHLPYSTGINIEPADNKVYCFSTGGLFVYSLEDNSVDKLTKVNGLSDVVISAIQYIPEKNALIIGYENGNIDMIQNNTIYNISDIYRKQLTGSKAINNINYLNGMTYLSCGFGIVLLDVDKLEIKDTYLIGQNSTYLNINEVCVDENYIYAATSKGLYKAPVNDQNLVNYSNWTIITNINNNNKEFSHIVYFDNHLFATYNDDVWNSDTVYFNNGNTWVNFDTTLKNIQNMVVSNNKLILVDYNFLRTYESDSFNHSDYYSLGSLPRDAEFSSNGTLWIADNNMGLVWLKPGAWSYDHIFPNGPTRKSVLSVETGGDYVWVVPGGRSSSLNNLWMQGEIYWFKDQNWINYSSSQVSELSKTADLCEIAINPNNSKQVFFGSYGGGVIEFNNGSYIAHYTENNSALQTIYPDEPYVRIGGMTVDEDENLWVTSCGVDNLLTVRKSNGQWKGFALEQDMGANLVGKVIAAQNGTKWIILPKGRGLFAFNENKTIENESDDQKKYVSVVDESGDVISNDIRAIAEDKEGLIWVGTSKGVVFYYSPENVFSSSVFYAQQIKIPSETPGQANYLLEAETVTAIAVDGANRKWFGTESGGVFLMSSDATNQILHFTTENSPLLSNAILAISIEHSSGEVFIATDQGLISYRSTATKGEESFHNVYAFPNPVRPGYDGEIAIKGLVTNADVKITDIVGNLVYQTKAEGGQAIWNGRNFSGEKVQTGVYLVFCNNEDGLKTIVTKILFVN